MGPLTQLSARVALGLVVTVGLVEPSLAQPSPTASQTGIAGTVTTDFGSEDIATAVAIQPDGELLVAGGTGLEAESESGKDFALVRYRPDGFLDPSFGRSGKVTTDFGGKIEEAEGIAVLPGGSILVVGNTGNDTGEGIESGFAMARYMPDGSLDPSFGTSGRVVTDFGSSEFGASAVAVQADGKIVVVGSTGLYPDFAVARYTPDGSLDPGFGRRGR